MKRFALSGLILLVLSASANAVTVKQYADMKAKGGDEWAIIASYVSGVGAGLLHANVQLVLDHEKPLFCPPQHLALNMDNYLALLDAELARAKPSSDVTIEVVLTYAILKAFPCTPEK